MQAFRILTVCTGNICRSPLAERVLQHRLHERLGPGAPVEVDSAGTGALTGSAMDAQAAAVLGTYGIDCAGHQGRALLPDLVARADLVLAATRRHRAAAVSLQPRASRYTFTLREFARLAEAVDPADLPPGSAAERCRAAVALAAARRGTVLPDPDGDDIEDPYRRPHDVHVRVGAAIREALRAPVELLVTAALPTSASAVTGLPR